MDGEWEERLAAMEEEAEQQQQQQRMHDDSDSDAGNAGERVEQRDAFGAEEEEAWEGEEQAEDVDAEFSTPAAAAAHPTHLSPEETLRLVHSSAQLLLLDVPPTTHLGVDCWQFNVGERFRGMKLVPPGAHFIWSAPSGPSPASSEESAPRSGCWAHLCAGDVWVRRWDPRLEALVPLEDADEEARYIAGARRLDFDAGQGSYPLREAHRWKRLSDCISAELVRRLEPVDKMIGSNIPAPRYTLADKQPGMHAKPEKEESKQEDSSMVDTGDASSAAASSHTAAASSSAASPAAAPSSRGLESLHRSFRPTRSSSSFYTRVPSLSDMLSSLLPADADAESRAHLVTQLSMDASPMLDRVIAECGGETNLLGELQFAFVALLIGQDEEGLEQWKALTNLLSSCVAAVSQRHAMYERWVSSVLRAQLAALPRDFFIDSLSGGERSFLPRALSRLFRNVSSDAELPLPQSLVYSLRALRERIASKFLFREDRPMSDSQRTTRAGGHARADLPPVWTQAQRESQQVYEAEAAKALGRQQQQTDARSEEKESDESAARRLREFKQRLMAEAEEDEYAPTIADE